MNGVIRIVAISATLTDWTRKVESTSLLPIKRNFLAATENIKYQVPDASLVQFLLSHNSFDIFSFLLSRLFESFECIIVLNW